MNITVVFNTPTRRARRTPYALTDEDTRHSVEIVVASLKRQGFTVRTFAVTEDTIPSLYSIKTDCIFNLIEWTGRDLDLSIQSLRILEELNIPFTGSGREGYENTTNKIYMKQLFHLYNIPTPAWQVFYSAKEPIRRTFQFPVIVKPALEHCSVGISSDAIARNAREVHELLIFNIDQHRQPFIVEEYIKGDEYHIPIIEQPGSIGAKQPAQIYFSDHMKYPMLTFSGRWIPGHPEFIHSSVRSPRISMELGKVMSRESLKAFTLLGLRDYARVDLRVRKNKIYILEINSNPGLDDNPEYEMMYSYLQDGISFDGLVGMIMLSTMARSTPRLSLRGKHIRTLAAKFRKV